MNGVVTFRWPRFCLTYDRRTGEVTTHYDRWRYARVRPGPDNREHGRRLGLRASAHLLAHELAHHLIALACGLDSSPVVWRSAHFWEQPAEEARQEEDAVAALTDYAFGEGTADHPSLVSLATLGVNAADLRAELRALVRLAENDQIRTRPEVQL